MRRARFISLANGWPAVLLLLATLMIASCADGGAQLPTVSLTFKRADGTVSKPFTLEVSATDHERRKGLMYRREMAPDRGMVFVFPSEQVNSFWMKNTILSLDMLFLDREMRVVGILERVPPQNEEPRAVEGKSQYVIELGSGVAAANGITVGALGQPDRRL